MKIMRRILFLVAVFTVCLLVISPAVSATASSTNPFENHQSVNNERIMKRAFGIENTTPKNAGVQSFPKLTVKVTVIIDNYDDYRSVLSNSPGFSYSVKRSTVMGKYSSHYVSVNPNLDIGVNPDDFYGPEEIVWTVAENQKTIIFDPCYPNTNLGTPKDLLWFEPSGSTNSHFSTNGIVICDSSKDVAVPYVHPGKDIKEITAFNCCWIKNHPTSGNNGTIVNLELHLKYNPGIEGKEPPPEPKTKYDKVITPYEDQKNTYRLSLSLDTPVPDKEEPQKDVIFVLDTSVSMNNTVDGEGISRMQQLKNVMDNTVNILSKSDKNRINIISFGSKATRLVSNKNAKTDVAMIRQAINGLSVSPDQSAGTNYYAAIQEVKSVIGGLGSASEKIVFFMTDGIPTAAYPAAYAYSGYVPQYYPCVLYARYAAESLLVDRFYSIFVGGTQGEASNLQTITQAVKLNGSNTESEKFMIQAKYSDELNSALQLFLSFINNALYNVEIKDEISSYLDYAGNVSVTAKTINKNGGATEKVLVADQDYKLTINGRNISLKLLGNALPSTTYTLSFDVKANSKALEYYTDHADADGDGIVDDPETIYPDTGDEGTGEYSSGQPGLKSNAAATVKYTYGVDKTETKTYPHPVFQVEADPVSTEIRLTKELTGKTLEDGEFSFQLYDKNGNAVGEPVTNYADGEIVFEDLSFVKKGAYHFTVKELIPEEPNPRMTYDEREIPIEVNVSLNNVTQELEAYVSYPLGSTFKNQYQPEPIEVTLELEKILKGHLALKSGMFSFNLKDENGDLLETVSNGADDVIGKIKFSPLEFDNVGVYQYKISESIPIPVTPNFVFDLNVITVTVEVKDNNGKLEAVVSYSDTAFVNEYKVPPVSAQIEIPVILTGRRLTNGAFHYKLAEYNEEDGTIGKVVAEADNSYDGFVRFDSIQFEDPVERTFIAWQVEPEKPDAHMTYDTKQVIVHLTVTMDEETEQLTAETTYTVKNDDQAEASFYNIYHVRGGIW